MPFGQMSNNQFLAANYNNQRLPAAQFDRENALLAALGLKQKRSRFIDYSSGRPSIGTRTSATIDPDSFLGGLLGGFGSASAFGGGTLPAPDGYGSLVETQRADMNRLLGEINQFGDSYKADINRQFDAAGNTALARLEDRGLGSSTITASATSGIERERAQQMGRLQDDLIRQRTDLQSGFLQNIYGTTQRGFEAAQRDRQMQMSFLQSLLGGLL